MDAMFNFVNMQRYALALCLPKVVIYSCNALIFFFFNVEDNRLKQLTLLCCTVQNARLIVTHTELSYPVTHNIGLAQ